MDGEKSEERIKMSKFDFFLSLKADDEFGKDDSTSWVLVFFVCARGIMTIIVNAL